MFVKQPVKRVKTVKYRVEKPVGVIKDSHPVRMWAFDDGEVWPVHMVTFGFSAVDGRWELRDYAVECDTGSGPGTRAIAVPGVDADMPGWLAELAVYAAQER